MAKPIPGKQYTIQDENSLSQIAARAYGDETLWPRIWSANQFILRSGDPNLIFPGEVISIPVLPEREKLKEAVTDPVIPGKDMLSVRESTVAGSDQITRARCIIYIIHPQSYK